MNALRLGLALLTLAGPVAVFFALLRHHLAGEDHRTQRFFFALGTFAFGALLFLPAWRAEAWLAVWAGLDEHATATSDLQALVYAFFVAAPLEQGLKVLAVGPVWRTRHFEAKLDGVIFASAAALGFISAHNVELVLSKGTDWLVLGRALLAVPAHLFFAASWGYALGREALVSSQRGGAKKGLGGRSFKVTWLVAMLFNSIYDHLVFDRGPTALLGALPILVVMVAVSAVVARELLKPPQGPRSLRRRFLPAIAPPSMRAVREALSRSERPVMLRWIVIGALVTTGVTTVAFAIAVILGHRFGIDFTAVDRGESAGMASLVPLMLLAVAALLAFPFAGYLVARASSTRSVLEPAIAAGLAIAGSLVLLGLAAPVAVVFALAFAPVAFGLACIGAWIGIAR
ncbi:MAG: PrsW family glutamic-type intramembrane protease [Byssovorax sp.]